MKPAVLAVLSLSLALQTPTQAAAQGGTAVPCLTPSGIASKLAAVPPEQRLFNGKLRIVNVYKRQIQILLDSTASDERAAARWSAEVYPIHRAFWSGYVGDSSAFNRLATGLMPFRAKLLCEYVPKLLALELNARFERHANWLARTTGLSPEGTWYLAYGHGQTDMGGLGTLGMVIDFSNQAADSAAFEGLLTHELAHQVHGRRTDPQGQTVLGRVIAEGLATYIACVYAAGKRTPADCIGYSDAEWEWAVKHEGELRAFVKPTLASRTRGGSDSVASRSIHPVAGGPGAIGYFLGYRIVQSYTKRHGKDAWKALLRMPVATVVPRSGYAFR